MTDYTHTTERHSKLLKEALEETKRAMKFDISSTEAAKGQEEKALDKQIGGGHYKGCKIQPIEYIMANNMNYCEGNVVKYITRHHLKGGREDIEKVVHYCELLLALEYGQEEKDNG